MISKKVRINIPEYKLKIYKKLIETNPKIELKELAESYTS